MKEFQESRILRKIFFSRLFFFVLVFLAVFLIFSVEKVYKKSHQANLKNQEVEEKRTVLEQKKQNLKATLGQLETPGGVEEELRSKFRIKKPGEEYAVIIDEEVQTDDIGGQKTESNFFKKIWNFVKNIF